MKTVRTLIWTIVAGLGLTACAAQSKPPPQQQMPGEETEGTMGRVPSVSDPRLDEILERDNEIREFRRELGLQGDPSRSDREVWMVRPLSKARAVCPTHAYPQTPKCKDVCNLADHICENADAICDLADELKSNQWARDKCASAKASCKDGKKRCCDCNGDEPREEEESAPEEEP